MAITTALPTPESVLQLEPEELAPYLLEYLAQNKDRLHPNNLFESNIGDSVLRHYGNDTRVEEALREAWSWLVREGLLVERKGGWHFISRRGRRLKGRQDFAAYRRSNVLPKGSLHPIIAERVWSAFVRGEYETAVFQAFKEVEVAVRAGGRCSARDIGTALMGKAFKVRWAPLRTQAYPRPNSLPW